MTLNAGVMTAKKKSAFIFSQNIKKVFSTFIVTDSLLVDLPEYLTYYFS